VQPRKKQKMLRIRKEKKEKIMKIIKTSDGGNFWTEKYIDNGNGFISFETKTKTGKTFQNEINRSSINSIVEVGEVEIK